jgi:hypothetical protein
VHLVGFIIRIYHDARPSDCQIRRMYILTLSISLGERLVNISGAFENCEKWLVATSCQEMRSVQHWIQLVSVAVRSNVMCLWVWINRTAKQAYGLDSISGHISMSTLNCVECLNVSVVLIGIKASGKSTGFFVYLATTCHRASLFGLPFVWQVSSSNVSLDVTYPVWGYSWLSSFRPGKCRDSIST